MGRAASYVSGLGLLALVYGCSGSGPGSGDPGESTPPQGEAPQAAVTLPEAVSLPVPLLGQENSMWCWAATGEMVMLYLGRAVTQCSQANLARGRSDCCDATLPSECDQGGWPKFGENGFDSQRTTKTALTWLGLRQQIADHKPVAVSWEEIGGGGHMVAARGYRSFAGVDYVEINDPMPVGKGDYYEITYAAYVSGAGYTHWDDFYDIAKRPPP